MHVNVRSAVAGGDALSVPELLSVYFAWVQFDLVTSRFARPWMWREPSMAPMYATGSEFAWHEKAWANPNPNPNPNPNAAVAHLHTRRRPLSSLVGAERLVSK